jgi:hypothetical protein
MASFYSCKTIPGIIMYYFEVEHPIGEWGTAVGFPIAI